MPTTYEDATDLIRQGLAILDQLQQTGATEATIDTRVERVGRIAHLHLAFMEEHGGTMTLRDSRVLRREQYGPKMRSTANLFGTKDSGAILYRPVPYGTRARPSQEVRLTVEGERLAHAYRELHNVSD